MKPFWAKIFLIGQCVWKQLSLFRSTADDNLIDKYLVLEFVSTNIGNIFQSLTFVIYIKCRHNFASIFKAQKSIFRW